MDSFLAYFLAFCIIIAAYHFGRYVERCHMYEAGPPRLMGDAMEQFVKTMHATAVSQHGPLAENEHLVLHVEFHRVVEGDDDDEDDADSPIVPRFTPEFSVN